MSIRDMSDYVSGLWDWGFLDDCFGNTSIRVTDIDGLVERNGRFLIIETKKPGQDIPVGQTIMLERLAMTGLFIVLIVWGQANRPESALLIWKGKAGVCQKRFDVFTASNFRDIVVRWFQANETRYARSQKFVTARVVAT